MFVAAAAGVYAPVWTSDAMQQVPVRSSPNPGFANLTRADVIYQVWLVSRHARTLLTAPHRLYDTEACFPEEHSLALGVPVITLGVLAVPAFAITGDPVVTYNVVLVLLTLLGALAMYLLVLSWTGVPGAAIAAGLLYAFHPIRLTDITHPMVWDSTWTVFALWFAERLSSSGRWRDAVGLMLAAVLQLAASVYPLLAAVLVALPFLIWLLRRDRLQRVSRAQIACVIGVVALAAALVLGPYLASGLGEGALRRTRFSFAGPGYYLPGAWLFPGICTLLLASLGLFARRTLVLPRIQGDPRLALLAGGLLAAWLAAGNRMQPLPNLHALLVTMLPGLDAVRVVLRVFSGAHLVLALLAGLGAAALVRTSGRAGVGVAIALVVACGFEMLRAPSLGFERRYAWHLEAIRPDPEKTAFFAELARRGNRGPLLEIPVDQTRGTVTLAPPRLLQSLYHERRTSACFAAYPPPGRDELAALSRRLPEPEALDAITKLGFTTVIFHHDTTRPAAFRQLLPMSAAEERGDGVRHVHSTPAQTAFELLGGPRS